MRMPVRRLVLVGVLVGPSAACSAGSSATRATDDGITVAPLPVAAGTATGAPISGASSPEAAATAYLRAWGAGDPLSLCRVTTDAQRRVVVRTPEAEKLCVDRIAGHVAAVQKGMAPLASATVGAVTRKDPATAVPDVTTVMPAEARGLAGTLTLLLIQGKWFVRTG